MSIWFTHGYLAFTAEFRFSSVLWTLCKLAEKYRFYMPYSGSNTPIYNLWESGPGGLSKTCWNLTFTSTFTFCKTDIYILVNRHLNWHLQPTPDGSSLAFTWVDLISNVFPKLALFAHALHADDRHRTGRCCRLELECGCKCRSVRPVVWQTVWQMHRSDTWS